MDGKIKTFKGFMQNITHKTSNQITRNVKNIARVPDDQKKNSKTPTKKEKGKNSEPNKNAYKKNQNNKT